MSHLRRVPCPHVLPDLPQLGELRPLLRFLDTDGDSLHEELGLGEVVIIIIIIIIIITWVRSGVSEAR